MNSTMSKANDISSKIINILGKNSIGDIGDIGEGEGLETENQIKNIEKAQWLKNVSHYPETIENLRLLISLLDNVGIFDGFDLGKVSDMSGNKLNIIYAVLRVTNKTYNIYLDHVVKKIFRNQIKDLLDHYYVTVESSKNTNYQTLLKDQLTQDLDHFVNTIIKSQYPKLNKHAIKREFIKYIKNVFSSTFYIDLMAKMTIDISNNNFYEKNDKIFTTIINDFIFYTNNYLTGMCNNMIMYLDKIFDTECTQDSVYEIMKILTKQFDLSIILRESCIEMDIYSEQRINDDIIKNHKQKKIQYNNKKKKYSPNDNLRFVKHMDLKIQS